MSERLIALYNEMSQLTAPECARNCNAPHSCCSPEYCDMAEERARSFGISLLPSSHRVLKFMSPTGCTVPPWLRPLCTLHTCAINAVAEKPGDPVWTNHYFALREQIEALEWLVRDEVNAHSEKG